MSLTLTTQEVKPAVTATHEKITRLDIDITAKRVAVYTKFGSDNGTTFTPLANAVEKAAYIIKDTPLTNLLTAQQDVMVSAINTVTLSQVPAGDLVVKNGATVITEGIDYNVSGAVITLIGIADGASITADYLYDQVIPADPAFTTIVSALSDGTKSHYNNVKDAIYAKLIADGHMAGTVI